MLILAPDFKQVLKQFLTKAEIEWIEVVETLKPPAKLSPNQILEVQESIVELPADVL
jgi:hypothetical protein